MLWRPERGRHPDALEGLSLLGKGCVCVSNLEEKQISKATMTFRVQLLVFSHCTKNAYNIIRDFQRMLLTNFSFRHEPLSRVFISFAFFALFLPSCEPWISTVLERKYKAAPAMRVTVRGTRSISLMFHRGIT